MEEKLKPIHPGEVLLEEFLKPMNLSQNRVALAIGVPPRRINEIVLGKRSITADTALRLGRYFGMSPQFWLGLQMDYDLDVAEDALRQRLEQEVRPYTSQLAAMSSAGMVGERPEGDYVPQTAGGTEAITQSMNTESKQEC